MHVAARVEPDVIVIPASDALLDDPPRTFHVNVFAIARRPVTNEEFAAFVDDSGHKPAAWREGGLLDHPAERVTWADAVAYCRWLSVSSGRIYRLPDEREWEKAARAGVLERLGEVREWTNTWVDGGRVVRDGARVAQRLRPSDDLKGHGFRVVRSMTGR